MKSKWIALSVMLAVSACTTTGTMSSTGAGTPDERLSL